MGDVYEEGEKGKKERAAGLNLGGKGENEADQCCCRDRGRAQPAARQEHQSKQVKGQKQCKLNPLLPAIYSWHSPTGLLFLFNT